MDAWSLTRSSCVHANAIFHQPAAVITHFGHLEMSLQVILIYRQTEGILYILNEDTFQTRTAIKGWVVYKKALSERWKFNDRCGDMHVKTGGFYLWASEA